MAEGLNTLRNLIYSSDTLEGSLIAASIAADTRRILNLRCSRWLNSLKRWPCGQQRCETFFTSDSKVFNVCDQHHYPRDALTRSAGDVIPSPHSQDVGISFQESRWQTPHPTHPHLNRAPHRSRFSCPHLCGLHLRHRHPSTTRDLFSTSA